MSDTKNDWCYMCSNEGLEGGCPSCGKELIIGVRLDTKEVTSKDMTELRIPSFYKTNVWNTTELRESYIDLMDSPSFNMYVNQLYKCLEIIKSGALPTTSAIVSSPTGYSKTTWAYSCILEAFRHGYKVAPLIDTTQLKRIMIASSEGITKNSFHDGFHYSQYVSSDILFVCVTKGPEYVYAYEVITAILDIRSRLDKPTIIISDFSKRQLSALDDTKILDRLISAKGKINPYKYPAMFSFFDIKMKKGGINEGFR